MSYIFGSGKTCRLILFYRSAYVIIIKKIPSLNIVKLVKNEDKIERGFYK